MLHRLRLPFQRGRRPRYNAARLLKGLVQDERGLTATEFALFAPILVFGFLATVDIGIAAYQRMTMDHVLRAGAQSAMTDPGTANVMKVIQSTAAENFTLGEATPTSGKPSMSVAVERYCTCPDNPSVKLASCATVCNDMNTGPTSPRAYYSVSASRTYAGMIIPSLSFNPRMEVQVR